MPFDFYTTSGKARETALIDSGATGNFIDYRTILQYCIRTDKLQTPIPIRNMDGMNNRSGVINRKVDLVIRRGGLAKRTTFYVTNLG